jgi:hypothetical protein
MPLRRFKQREATHTGFASPGCAAPIGFLSLLAPCSSRGPSSLVSCWWRPWGSPFRGLFLLRSRHGLPTSHPLLALSSGRDRPTDPVRPSPVARFGVLQVTHESRRIPSRTGALFARGRLCATVSRSATASKEGHQPGAHAATSRESVRGSEDHACGRGSVPETPLLAPRLLCHDPDTQSLHP